VNAIEAVAKDLKRLQREPFRIVRITVEESAERSDGAFRRWCRHSASNQPVSVVAAGISPSSLRDQHLQDFSLCLRAFAMTET
jgi:hypothetical protein